MFNTCQFVFLLHLLLVGTGLLDVKLNVLVDTLDKGVLDAFLERERPPLFALDLGLLARARVRLQRNFYYFQMMSVSSFYAYLGVLQELLGRFGVSVPDGSLTEVAQLLGDVLVQR